jgi:hypothetical protein
MRENLAGNGVVPLSNQENETHNWLYEKQMTAALSSTTQSLTPLDSRAGELSQGEMMRRRGLGVEWRGAAKERGSALSGRPSLS